MFRLRFLRSASRKISAAFYNLSRAISEREALKSPFSDGSFDKKTSFARLFQEFETAVGEVAPEPVVKVPAVPAEHIPVDERNIEQDELLDRLQRELDAIRGHYPADVDIPVTDFEWPDFDKDDTDFEKEYREAVQDYVRGLKEAADTALKEALEAEEETRRDAASFQVEMQRLERVAEGRMAGGTSKAVLAAGRELIIRAGLGDKRLIGWRRITNSPRPCAFCAMLASRRVLYKTRRTAGDSRLAIADPGVHQFHDHCRCTAMPVFSREPSLSRRDDWFRQAWERAMEEGSAARSTARDKWYRLNVWRNWLNTQYRLGLVPKPDDFTETDQESDDAQEA